MNKLWNKLICKISGHVYPLKRLTVPGYLKKSAKNPLGMDEDIGEGAFVADTDKPCARCGKLT